MTAASAGVTPTALLATRLARAPAVPLLTGYDDAAGTREELSVATTANWVAKAANLLVDDYDLAAGARLAVSLPLHWRAGVFVLAGWAAGAVLTDDVAGADVLVDAALAFDTPRILAQPDAFVADEEPAPQQPALALAGRTTTAGELVSAATAVGLPAGGRLLSVLPLVSWDGLVAGLLAPLAAGGSAVWVHAPDPATLAARAGSERVTHSAGVDIPGAHRLV